MDGAGIVGAGGTLGISMLRLKRNFWTWLLITVCAWAAGALVGYFYEYALGLEHGNPIHDLPLAITITTVLFLGLANKETDRPNK
jgi:hypothetical protein